MKYLIGLDVGTSGAKCIMIDETGKVVASDRKSVVWERVCQLV